jgi:hypothetical protein
MPDRTSAIATTRSAFAGTLEGEARLLLLIDAFSLNDGTLQGRTKLAKLDFLLRYPKFFDRAMVLRNVHVQIARDESAVNNIEQRMVRYRYGPWDPAYYALLGALLGRGLITTVPNRNYLGFRTTPTGHEIAREVARSEPWETVQIRARLLRQTFRTQAGTFLKDWIYEHFPEVTKASWGEAL